HGGLKPSNIFLIRTEENLLRVKLTGFGLAAVRAQLISNYTPLTMSTSAIRALRYIAPEQAVGQDPDARSDIYNFGILLYEMLAGQTPFDAPAAATLKRKHQEEAPPPLKDFRPDAPDEWAQLIMEALDKLRQDRPQTVAEIARRLRRLKRI